MWKGADTQSVWARAHTDKVIRKVKALQLVILTTHSLAPVRPDCRDRLRAPALLPQPVRTTSWCDARPARAHHGRSGLPKWTHIHLVHCRILGLNWMR